jgi:hypothetical protein
LRLLLQPNLIDSILSISMLSIFDLVAAFFIARRAVRFPAMDWVT